MKKVQYQDKYDRTVTKKEGFSVPMFLFLLLLGIIPGIIYLVVKVPFMMTRGTYRSVKKNIENEKK